MCLIDGERIVVCPAFHNFDSYQAPLTKSKSPPSRNPWATHIELLLPKCNNTSDTVMGFLLRVLLDYFDGSRHASIDLVLCILFERVHPHLPEAPLKPHLEDWYSFQEYFGLHPSTIQYSTKKAKALFICSFYTDAWDFSRPHLLRAPSTFTGVYLKSWPFHPTTASLTSSQRLNSDLPTSKNFMKFTLTGSVYLIPLTKRLSSP
jgi:hypothetical protein